MGTREQIEKIEQELGKLWIDHVRESAKHEWHKHQEYQTAMSLHHYQDYRVIQQYNHVLTHLNWIERTQEGAASQ